MTAHEQLCESPRVLRLVLRARDVWQLDMQSSAKDVPEVAQAHSPHSSPFRLTTPRSGYESSSWRESAVSAPVRSERPRNRAGATPGKMSTILGKSQGSSR